MRMNQLCEGAFEVRSDGNALLGWIDLETLPAADGTGTVRRKYVAKPAGPRAARAALTMGEAAAYLAGTFN